MVAVDSHANLKFFLTIHADSDDIQTSLSVQTEDSIFPTCASWSTNNSLTHLFDSSIIHHYERQPQAREKL